MFEDGRDVIRGNIYVVKGERDQAAILWAWFQLADGFEDGNAGSFGPNEGPGHVKTILRQELIKVVT